MANKGDLWSSSGVLNFYVHRHFSNYLAYGTRFKTATGDSPFSMINKYKNMHDMVKAQYINNNNQLRDTTAEKQYEKIIFGKGKLGKNQQQLRNNMVANIQEAMENGIKVGLNNPMLPSKELSISNDADINNLIELIREGKNNTTRIYKTTYEKMITKINNALNMINTNTTFQNLSELTQLIKKTEGEWNKIVQDYNKAIVSIASNQQGMTESTISMQGANEISFNAIKEMVSVINSLPFIPIKSASKGTAGEIGASMAELALQRGAKKTLEYGLEDLKKDFLKGSQQNTVTLDTPFLFGQSKDSSHDVADQFFNFNISLQHVNKTDVSVKASGHLFNGYEERRLSVKNVKSLKNIHLVDNTPLISLLQSFDGTGKFAGHYANIIADSAEQYAKKELTQWRELMENIILEQSLINAFKGYDRNTAPNLFVAIDSNKKRVYIFDINVLIGKVLTNNIFKSTINQFTLDGGKQVQVSHSHPSLNQLSVPFDNKFGYMTNSAVNLFKLHKMNVSVNLNSLI